MTPERKKELADKIEKLGQENSPLQPAVSILQELLEEIAGSKKKVKK
jgi:hypothetical protein